MIRCKVFTDPFYHSDNYIEFEANEVVSVERKTLTLFLRGKHQVTYVTLKNGAEHALEGDLVAEIEAAQARNRARESNA